MNLQQLKAWAAGLKRDIHALYLASRHPRVPLLAKLIIVVVVAYALSPIDLIPDFIPVLGYLDDLLLLPLGIWLAIRLMPADIWLECQAQASQSTTKLPTNRYALAIIIIIWVALAIALILWLWPKLLR